MTDLPAPMRHLDTPITWPAAIAAWLISGTVFLVTLILSVIGLMFNLVSGGTSNRQGWSWSAFDSPAPASWFILLVLLAAWLFFTGGWCMMAAAAFKQTYKQVYQWTVLVTVLIVAAGGIWLATL